MNRICCVILIVLFLSPVACTVIKDDEFEYEVDPKIGQGNEDPDDNDTGTETETGTDTESDTATDSSTDTVSGTDTASDAGTLADTSSN
ncbi:MAG: hypothetical protein JXX14_03315 [Deltaproteobacteria bacterium]|nr:hypothetical protein [Deltaproteobacteria bacterium]